jgi:hypothetical protein
VDWAVKLDKLTNGFVKTAVSARGLCDQFETDAPRCAKYVATTMETNGAEPCFRMPCDCHGGMWNTSPGTQNLSLGMPAKNRERVEWHLGMQGAVLSLDINTKNLHRPR